MGVRPTLAVSRLLRRGGICMGSACVGVWLQERLGGLLHSTLSIDLQDHCTAIAVDA